MPGYSTRTFGAGRVILHAVEDPQNMYLPGGVVLDAAAFDALVDNDGYVEQVALAGFPLYQDAATGLYKPWTAALDGDVVGILSDEFGVDLSDGDAPARLLIRGRVKSDMIFGFATLLADAAGQPYIDGIQFWDGDSRVL